MNFWLSTAGDYCCRLYRFCAADTLEKCPVKVHLQNSAKKENVLNLRPQKRFWVELCMVLGLLGLALLGLRAATLVPSQRMTEALSNDFSSMRALDALQVIARESHPTGTRANVAVRAYLLDAL
jgi:hypothetical protein